MIKQSTILLNQFLNFAGFSTDNLFHTSDFTKMPYNAYIDGCNRKLIEIKKEQYIKYKGISFSICITGSILYETHELYMISMECLHIDKDDHLIIEEYLTHLIINFTSTINQNISAQLSLNNLMQAQFEDAFLKLMDYYANHHSYNKLYYLIHFICSPQLYFMEDSFYFKISPMKNLGIILELLLNIYQEGEFL